MTRLRATNAQRVLTLLAALLLWLPAEAQISARTMFLVARPGMPDPNFRETVVLVSQNENTQAIGVIINRPTTRSLASILPGERFRQFSEPVFIGGPVGAEGLFALFRAEKSPGDSVTMLPGLYFALAPATIDELMSRPPAGLRFFSGYAGWGPGQLPAEIARGDWFVLEADADTAFRKDTANLWQDMVRRARAVRTQLKIPILAAGSNRGPFPAVRIPGSEPSPAGPRPF